MSKGGIIIVEDSFIVAYHLQATLEGEGYTILAQCDSGDDAIEKVDQLRPDLVLMDIMLNGTLDGIETATLLRNKFKVPVIYITALTDYDTIQRAKITEPYGYLTKPFEDREIITVIEMALYKHSIELQLRQSEERYYNTINSIGDCVISIDRDYRVTYMNPSAIALTKWILNDATGKLITDVVHLVNEVTHEVNINPLQCPLGIGNVNKMPDELVLISKTGLQIPIGESSLSPLLDNKGEFVGLIIVFKDLTDKVEHQQLLREMERNRLTAIIEGQEKERARIAKDLHDGLGQVLNAIKMNTKILIQDSATSEKVMNLLDEAIQESVRISENLLPSKLRDFDLNVCLRSLCKGIDESTQVSVNFESVGESLKLNQFTKVNLFRIAQEAINNSLKHSKASCINVLLNQGKDLIRLSIEDNGRGITNDRSMKVFGNNGLINMKDRAEIMGGHLNIESDPARGTIVIVEIPSENLYSKHEK